MTTRPSMIKGDFPVAHLREALYWQISIRGLTQKEAAQEIGIHESLLVRMKAGKRPDVDTLTRVIHWLEIDPKTLFDNSPHPNALAEVRAIFHGDPSLNPETARALMNIVTVAYNVLREKAE